MASRKEYVPIPGLQRKRGCINEG